MKSESTLWGLPSAKKHLSRLIPNTCKPTSHVHCKTSYLTITEATALLAAESAYEVARLATRIEHDLYDKQEQRALIGFLHQLELDYGKKVAEQMDEDEL